jgi:hypothetical protein
MSTTTPDPLPPATGTFAGRASFRDLIRQAFAQGVEGRWREIVVCDVDFSDWPLAERTLVDDLTRWALWGGRLLMLAHDYHGVQRDAPLFVRWRQRWSHQVECLAVSDLGVTDVPSFLWSARWCLQRHDVLRSAGQCASDAETLNALAQRAQSLQSRGGPAFPADVLGL